MIQLLLGIALGLIVVAFFIAAMYYVLPDYLVDKALSWFNNMFKTLLDSTLGRIITTMLYPVTATTKAVMYFVYSVGWHAGPLAGFAVAVMGMLRSSWALLALVSSDRAMASVEAMQRATIVLLALMAVGAFGRVLWLRLKYRLFISWPILAKKSKKTKPRKRDKWFYVKLGYIAMVVIAFFVGVHMIRIAVEIMWPNSRTVQILEQLDLMEKFYLVVTQDIRII